MPTEFVHRLFITVFDFVFLRLIYMNRDESTRSHSHTHLSWGVSFSSSKLQSKMMAPGAPAISQHLGSSAEWLSSAEEGFSTWSSSHPLSLFTSQCCSLSTVISRSFRTASLGFTSGSISVSLEGISKAQRPPYHPSMVLVSCSYLDPQSSWLHAATEYLLSIIDLCLLLEFEDNHSTPQKESTFLSIYPIYRSKVGFTQAHKLRRREETGITTVLISTTRFPFTII